PGVSAVRIVDYAGREHGHGRHLHRGVDRALVHAAAAIRDNSRAATPERAINKPRTPERLEGEIAERFSERLNTGFSQQGQLAMQLVAGRCVSSLACPDLGINLPDIEIRSVRCEGTKYDIDPFKDRVEASPLRVAPLCRA